MGRRSYSGTAVPTVLSGGLGALDLLFTVQDATGYPDGSGGPFYVTLARGVAGEEKILCDSRSGLTFTVNTAGRGADGTVATSHAASSTTVEHTITKTDLDEANRHVNQTAEADDPHPQYIKTTAANAAFIAKGGTQSATVTTSESTTSGAFTALATAGPAVTVTIGASGRALVLLSADLRNSSSGGDAFMGFAISGATTVAASQGTSLALRSASGGVFIQGSRAVMVTGLVAGSTTFTAQYRSDTVSSSTSIYAHRQIVVIPL